MPPVVGARPTSARTPAGSRRIFPFPPLQRSVQSPPRRPRPSRGEVARGLESEAAMIRRTCWNRLTSGAVVSLLLLPLSTPVSVTAQDAAQTGTVRGRVLDARGGAVAGAQIFLVRPAISTASGATGDYVLDRVPVGAQVLHARMLGFRPDSASVTVVAGQQATQDFSLRRDPLQLQDDGGHRHPDAPAEPRRQRGGDHPDGRRRSSRRRRGAPPRCCATCRASPGWRARAAR